MEFKVKRSFLPIFLVNLALVFLICVSIPFAYNIWVFLVVFAICFTLFCLYNTAVIFASCKLEGNKLTYKTGLFKYEIDTTTIEKVEKNKSYAPSLAISFERVRIVVKVNDKHKFYYISVVDRDKLIELLSKKEAPKKQENKEVEKQAEKKPVKKVATKKSAKK